MKKLYTDAQIITPSHTLMKELYIFPLVKLNDDIRLPFSIFVKKNQVTLKLLWKHWFLPDQKS